MGFDWTTACEKVISESQKFGEKSDQLKSIKSWDKKNVDCKNVINELASILDEKNLLWTHRLGKELGKNTPIGELADFLGDEVVNAIWN